MAPHALAFDRALRDPRRAQEQALRRITREVPALRGVDVLADLRSLPFTSYDDVSAAIDGMASASPQDASARTRLTRAPVIRFERSGGSSGAQKLLPMTRPFLAEMNRALEPWLFSLYASIPGVSSGSAYWSISPIGAGPRATPSGIPIGADGDSSYLPSFARAFVDRILAVPDSLAHLTDVDDSRYATLRLLLDRDDLALISVWSPTYLTRLLAALDDNCERLLHDLERGTCSLEARFAPVVAGWPLRAAPARAQHLRAIARERPLTARDLWPKLALLSMWTHASSARFVAEARARFLGVPLQPKGLLAVEGVVSVPWPDSNDNDGAGALAIRSHVLEFVDDSGRAHGAHEIERGRVYEVVLTTSAGLVRYRLGDLVRVVGAAHATPRVEFLGRAGLVSDLVGEKLSAAFVATVIDDVARAFPVLARARFAMLAPRTPGSPGAPHYRLYLELAPRDACGASAASDARSFIARAVELALRAGHPYAYARDLRQLGPVDVVAVERAAERYERACLLRGQRAGDIKHTPLHRSDDWDHAFHVELVACSPP
jgi:hypothetical protein